MALVSLIVIAGAAQPGLLDISLLDTVENPLGLDWMPSDPDALFALTVLTYAAASLVATFGLVRRYRAGGPVVRAQIRWFAASITVSLCLLVLMIASSGNEALNGIAWPLWIASLLLPPIAIAIAILRYRLYDIDRIVSNAIGYGVVTIVLFAVFAGVNVVLVSQVSPLVSNEGHRGGGIDASRRGALQPVADAGPTGRGPSLPQGQVRRGRDGPGVRRPTPGRAGPRDPRR